VKEHQCGECGRNVASASIGRISLDDPPRLLQSDDISVSMVCGAEGAGEGNRPSPLEATATLDP
jgi:hypothetical protein